MSDETTQEEDLIRMLRADIKESQADYARLQAVADVAQELADCVSPDQKIINKLRKALQQSRKGSDAGTNE
jgi:hypothetical protein